jgi:signal transduction histidine kinase
VAQRTFDLRGLMHAILTCVTAGPGLGFNRAVLFLVDEDRRLLTAAMAIGPATSEEAHATWSQLASEQKSLDELLYEAPSAQGRTGFQTLVEGVSLPLEEQTVSRSRVAGGNEGSSNLLMEAYRSRRVVKIADVGALPNMPPRLREVFAGTEAVCVPLVAKERSLGLVVADNAFSREPIAEGRVQVLRLLALLAGLALDDARIYGQLEGQARRLKDTLDQLKATQDQLIHSERLATVGAVVARVSHEIRNPLATIGGFARTLGAHPDDMERVARNADIIVEEVEKLEALLKEMLDFTSPKPPALEPTDLNRVLGALANVHQGELSERHVALTLELAADLPVVPADRNQMQRVFLNLWQNALQAMEESDGVRTLTVRTWRNGESVKVAFADTGRGIAREARPHIFTPFFTTKPRGTGLGMAVVKKIVDDHHGSIEVHSGEGVGLGTTVIISLPIRR